MSNGKYIDLGLLVREPLVFAVPIIDEGDNKAVEEFKIPGELSTGFVLKMTKYHNDMREITDDEIAFNKMKEIVVDILNLDKSKEIDVNYVDEYLDDFRMVRVIFEKTMEHIQEISKDENLNFPKSISKKTTKNKK